MAKREPSPQLAETLDENLATADRLINSRLWATAVEFCEQVTERWNDNVQAWLKFHLACLLVENTTQADYAHEQAKLCEGYEDVSRHIVRDQILFIIRHRKAHLYPYATAELRRLREETTDPNEQLCLLMVRARLTAACGRYHSAIEQHRRAEAGWSKLDEPNDQWRFNNLVHWQYAANAANQMRDAVQLGKQVLAGTTGVPVTNAQRNMARILMLPGTARVAHLYR
jgi:hypothetical protein